MSSVHVMVNSVMTTLEQIVQSIEAPVNLSLVLATVWAISEVFAKHSTCVLTIRQYATSRENYLIQSDIMQDILKRGMRNAAIDQRIGLRFIVGVTRLYDSIDSKIYYDEGFPDKVLEKKDKGIWFLDSMEAFYQLERDLSTKQRYHFNGIFCIIYTGQEHHRLKNIREIFRRFFTLYITNVNVFISIDGVPWVFTYFPFGRHRCHSSKPTDYMSFADISENVTYVTQKPFFPNKVENMHGCELLVSTWTQSPYVFVETDPETGKLTRLHGIEGSILSIMAEQMNFSMRIVEPSMRTRGYVYANGTATGAIQTIIEGKANVSIACHLVNERLTEIMLATYSYMNLPLLLAIPKGRPMTPFQRLSRPFKYILWSFLSCLVLVSIMSIFAIRFLCHSRVSAFVFGALNRIPFTNFWVTLYGAPIHGHLPKRNFARYILTLWLVFTFVIRNAYSGELFIILQDSRASDSLKTLKEVVEKNYTFYTVPIVEYILRKAVGEATIKYLHSSQNGLAKFLSELQSYDSKTVLPLLDATIQSYNQNLSNRENPVNVLPETIITVPLTMYMRKHSYFESEFNDVLQNIMSSGLVKKFMDFYVKGEPERPERVYDPTALSIWQLMGIFIIYAFLMLLCSVVFLFELWSKNSTLLRPIIDFFNI